MNTCSLAPAPRPLAPYAAVVQDYIKRPAPARDKLMIAGSRADDAALNDALAAALAAMPEAERAEVLANLGQVAPKHGQLSQAIHDACDPVPFVANGATTPAPITTDTPVSASWWTRIVRAVCPKKGHH